jgi:hypothetical protein
VLNMQAKVNFNGYYKSKKGDMYRALNPAMHLQDNKLVQVVLFMAVATGALFTIAEDEFLNRFVEVVKDESK